MKILVIGNGGREHAIVWKLACDSSKPQVFCAPGNAGTAELASNVAIDSSDIKGLLEWARKNKPDLTVVGPEAPLCAGLADAFKAEGFRVFGPSAAAARMEGSKVFSKEVMEAGGVPTARARTFTDAAAAGKYLMTVGVPIVIKAEGLAAGKGVYVCMTMEAARAAIEETMVKKIFGEAGARIVIEEFLDGEEASILALVDGRNVVILASAQDHKRVFNNDQGPNTGGMGAYSPAPVVTDSMRPVIKEEVFERTLAELRKRGIVYQGVLYAGLMIGRNGIKVLEFNCRFGDPETQVILPRMDCDLVPVLNACIDGTLSEKLIRWRKEPCVCVVMASGGYPGEYLKDQVIEGLAEVKDQKDVVVFHAGTRISDGKVITSGGRVLGITALGADLKSAIKNAYRALLKVRYNQSQYRTDIGARALRRP